MTIRFVSLAVVLLLSGSLFSCSAPDDSPFRLLPVSQTSVSFENRVENTPEFNIQNYLYFYDGAGVAVGDLNNNGLPDLFFVGNMVENKLYLNRGNFEFEDITEQAGVAGEEGSWSTGVTMADVTGNGYLDIYVSRVNYLNKSGRNQLFVNNGDLTFTERAAEFGLDFEGYSTQAAFFDYNKNGRLDLFLLNHSFHGENTYGQAERLRRLDDPKAGDRLFRNDGARFTEVTAEAGIFSSPLGYGLGLAITDITMNGYPDIYVGNDFHEDDYFYINNGDGTFTERLYEMVSQTSNSSMGNDVADINNNGRMDIVSLDMMPWDHETYMRSGGPDPVMVSDAKRSFGFGAKNNRNTLQLNRGYGADGLPFFSETAFASGVAISEWSWAALFADFQNRGRVDLFITNGMPLRPNDKDYVAAVQRIRQQYTGEELEQKEYEMLDMMPSIHVPNLFFRNNGDLTFSDQTEAMGFGTPTYSSGAVYADLNGNGFLDLVVSNINERAYIYENRFAERDSANAWLRVKLEGPDTNTTGIGTKLFLYANGATYYREQYPSRGFQSSVEQVLHVGLGEVPVADSVLVIWPDDSYQKLTELQTNQTVEIRHRDAGGVFNYEAFRRAGQSQPLLEDHSEAMGLDAFTHQENRFNDFEREPLMPYRQSTRGPALAVADLTGDGNDEIYLGSSHNTPSQLLRFENGRFTEVEQNDFLIDRRSEDVAALFVDADGDGRPDLYVSTAGNQQAGATEELLDRLYIQTDGAVLTQSLNSLPDIATHTSVVAAADVNGNGHPDLFVGGHTLPWRYGIGPESFLLQNDGRGIFTNVTDSLAPELEIIGNVTSAVWIQQPGRELPDLVVAGEWMGIRYFENRDGTLADVSEERGFANTNGLWQSVHTTDLTGNGHPDLIAGNMGINNRLALYTDQDHPAKLYIADFDDTGQSAPLVSIMRDGREVPFEQLDEMMSQITDLSQRGVQSYRDFARKSVRDLFTAEELREGLTKEIRELRSIAFLNDGNGNFRAVPLPIEAQWFPVFAITSADLTGNGLEDLIIGGNLFDVKPSYGGKQGSGHGLIIRNRGDGQFDALSPDESGFLAKGEIRAIHPIQIDGDRWFIVARNNDSPLLFKPVPSN
ncbi:MAG: VCBS repeat-containing protein [Balneolaceae bacterium]